jgi:hypothetical protein
VAWADVNALTLAFLPYPGNIFATFPGQPFLVVNKIKVDPFPGTAPNIFPMPYTDPAFYQYAQVTVDYKVPVWDDGTWGDTSPREGSIPNANADTVLSDRVTYGGEFMILPAAGLQWTAPFNTWSGTYGGGPQGSFITNCTGALVNIMGGFFLQWSANPNLGPGSVILLSGFAPADWNGYWNVVSTTEPVPGIWQTQITPNGSQNPLVLSTKTGTIYLPLVPGSSGVKLPATQQQLVSVRQNVQAGRFVPILEHTINWHYVLFPPWTAIRNSVGSVNNASFANCPTGTLLFVGAEASIDFTAVSTKFWTLQYKFSFKNNGQGIGDAQLPGGGPNPFNTDAVTATGWNYFLRPETGAWEELNVKSLTRVVTTAAPAIAFPAGPLGIGGTASNLQLVQTVNEISPSQPIYRYTSFPPLFQPGM